MPAATLMERLLARTAPEAQRAWNQRLVRLVRPALFGSLRRTTPLSTRWGSDRGTPLDRFYIEDFLDDHRSAIRGRVLEVKDSGYTDRFGSGVEVSDVLDLDAANPRATVVADLAAAHSVPADRYDCFILTQTLQLIYDVHAAIAHAHRILRPGGVLLVTVPCASQVVRGVGAGDFWRFTPQACERLFADCFGPGQVEVRGRGNVLATVAFLMGLAHEELTERELAHDDPLHPLLVTVRAVKAGGAASAR
jgi:hypothetical protein